MTAPALPRTSRNLPHRKPAYPHKAMPQATVQFRPYLLRAAHLRMLVGAVELAQDSLDEVPVLEAAGRFFRRVFADRAALESHLAERDAHSQFFPWLLWDADLPDGPLGMRLLETRRTAVDREVLLTLLATQPDVFQVVGTSAQSTVLERVADGRCVAVIEPVLRAVATRGELYVARVLECGDCYLLDAVHACLPGTARRSLVRAARRTRELPPEQALVHLMTTSTRAMRRVEVPTEPWRQGDPLLHATLAFEVVDPRALDAALDLAVTATRLEQRSSRRFSILDATFGPVGAVLRREGARLYAATTAQRADDLQAAVTLALPGLRHACTLFRDPDVLLDPSRWPAARKDGLLARQGEQPRDRWRSDELQSFARDWIGECLATFHDTAHPWLGGVTPREAIRTPTGRSQVRAWLRTVEQVTAVAGPGYESALQSIWRDLSGT